MGYNLIWMLISVLLSVQGIKAMCEESRQLESSCGSYCFNVIRPILDHTKKLQSQVDKDEAHDKCYTLQKLDNIEHTLQEKFHALELKIEQEVKRKEEIKSVNMLAFEKIGSKYYYIEHNEGRNWFAAVNKCHELGGHLANLQNLNEFVAVTTKLKQRFYWIDINDLAEEGKYYSLTTGLNATFVKWYYPDEPNNGGNNEHCVQLREVNDVYTMNDCPCDHKCNFICEKEAH